MLRRTAVLTVALAGMLALSACANTIRGAGADLGSTVDATQGAVQNVVR